jgi:hypothetical protein
MTTERQPPKKRAVLQPAPAFINQEQIEIRGFPCPLKKTPIVFFENRRVSCWLITLYIQVFVIAFC